MTGALVGVSARQTLAGFLCPFSPRNGDAEKLPVQGMPNSLIRI